MKREIPINTTLVLLCQHCSHPWFVPFEMEQCLDICSGYQCESCKQISKIPKEAQNKNNFDF